MLTEHRHSTPASFRFISNLTAAAAIWLFLLSHALAQCTGAAGPWAICPQWSGLELSLNCGAPGSYAYAPLDDFDLSGSGMAGFPELNGITSYIAASPGAAFNSLNFSGNPLCYVGNFDGSGRSSVACPGANGMVNKIEISMYMRTY